MPLRVPSWIIFFEMGLILDDCTLLIFSSIDEGFVRLHPDSGDGIPAEFAGRFVVGPDLLPREESADGFEIVAGQDRGLGAKVANWKLD